MPSVYTELIQEGCSFNEFVMKCARAMGACVMMRDDPVSTPIPERFAPTDYYAMKLDESKKELSRLKEMSQEEAEDEAKNQFQTELKHLEERMEKNRQIYNKYNVMLQKIDRWIPPTEDHLGLKDFMKSQVKESMDFDCDARYYTNIVVENLTGESWRSKNINKLLGEIDYYYIENQKELTRVEARNVWVKQLRNSIMEEM